MNDTRTPGERLRQRRRELGLTAQGIAERTGKTATAVRNQENGTNGLRPEVAAQYAPILGVTPQWLLYGEGDPQPFDAAPRRPTSPVELKRLPDGRASLDLNVTLPFSVALQILTLVEEAQK